MDNHCFITENAFIGEKVLYADILYAMATPTHTQLVTVEGTYNVLMPIDGVQKKLPGWLFKRVHPSYIVSIESVMSYNLELGFLYIRKNKYDLAVVRIPVDRSYDFTWFTNKTLPGGKENPGK